MPDTRRWSVTAPRPLVVFQPVHADSVAALEALLRLDPGRWLAGGHAVDDTAWGTTLRVGQVRREAICRVGPVEGSPWGLSRTVAWIPAAHPRDPLPIHQALPEFHGSLSLHRDRAVLILEGGYDVPGGWVGALLDAAGLSGIARRTGAAFLADVAERAGHGVATG